MAVSFFFCKNIALYNIKGKKLQCEKKIHNNAIEGKETGWKDTGTVAGAGCGKGTVAEGEKGWQTTEEADEATAE